MIVELTIEELLTIKDAIDYKITDLYAVDAHEQAEPFEKLTNDIKILIKKNK